MWHRKLNSGLALLAVAAAVGCLTGTLTFFKSFDFQTAELLSHKREVPDESCADDNPHSY